MGCVSFTQSFLSVNSVSVVSSPPAPAPAPAADDDDALDLELMTLCTQYHLSIRDAVQTV